MDRAFSKALHKKWDKIYWLIDIHETIIKPNYDHDVIPKDFYPESRETLQILSGRPDIILIMFTCSWPDQIQEYQRFFQDHEIDFKYHNKNPEVETIEGRYGYYLDKPYADVILDDKAGFDWRTDWLLIKDNIHKYPILSEIPHFKL